jgi:hypothetical protein
MTIDALIRTVFWGLLGVRSGADHRADFDDIKVPLALPVMASSWPVRSLCWCMG